MATALLLAASFLPQADAAEEYYKSYTVGAHPRVRVQSDDASVRVLTTDSNQVEFHVRSEHATWGLGLKFGARPHVDSRQAGDLVELTAHLGWSVVIGVADGTRARIEVSMPRNADLELETDDGSVEVASVNGNVTVRTSDGSIKAAQLTGKIDLHANDGSITADDLQGDLKLHTGDGHIRAANLKGRCEAASSDGSIQVAGRFEFLDLRSDDGSIVARVEPGSQLSSTWSLHSRDGSVRLALPRDLKASLDASSEDGHISYELPVKVEGEASRRHLYGTLNGGGPAVLIHTDDGSIVLAAI